MEDKTDFSERELLATITEVQRRSLRHARITSIVCLVIAALLVLLALLTLPRAASALNRMDAALVKLEDTMGTLNEFIENADVLSEAAARLGEMDIDSLNSGIREISQIDFETLNNAIGDLSDVIQPLARFVNLFN